MIDTSRSLEVETAWTAAPTVDCWIEQAMYAILSERKGVTLVMEETGEVVRGVTITLNRNGLHYDADTSLMKSFLQRKLNEDYEVTRSWPECEAFLQDN